MCIRDSFYAGCPKIIQYPADFQTPSQNPSVPTLLAGATSASVSSKDIMALYTNVLLLLLLFFDPGTITTGIIIIIIIF